MTVPRAATDTSIHGGTKPTSIRILPLRLAKRQFPPVGRWFARREDGTQPTYIKTASGVTKTITYYPYNDVNAYKVHYVALGSSTWTYSYSTSNNVLTTTVTDPNGGIRTFVSNTLLHHALSDQDQLGRKTTWDTYDSYDHVTHLTKYAGGVEDGTAAYSYDGRGNVLSVSIYPKGGGTALVTSATYSSSCPNTKTCNKPLTTTDAAGVVTTYTYDGNSGQVATVTLPAVGGVAPQTRYAYSQITPYLKNSAGTLVAQAPVWRLTSTSSCMTLASCSVSIRRGPQFMPLLVQAG